MSLFGNDDMKDQADDKLHEEKGRWEERLDNFRESISRRFDESDRPLDEPSEYDESTDDHLGW